jgi:hypothetical protein
VAFLEDKQIHKAYEEATKEADIWRKDYTEYERLADNGLLTGLDESLPEVNDGSLAAALYKLPKRIVSTKLRGRAKALDSEDDWKTELATMTWERDIVPHANTQAPFHRKWKDAVRKSAIYGGQPIVTLFVENGNYNGSDFIVPFVNDIKLEAGKVSDYDSDIVFWDVYYSKSQVQDMIDEAQEDAKSDPKTKNAVTDKKVDDGDEDEPGSLDDGYNKWNIGKLQELLDSDEEKSRSGNEESEQKMEKGIKKSGIHFYIAFQRGVDAPFKMIHKGSKTVVREWSNPDPTGDIPVHYLYCYQDFINPYGIGICKLAGGTQNVLDYMRQADVLATQIGLRPPKLIEGDDSQVDYDSLTYTEDADWVVGNAKVQRMEMATGIYNDLPNRIQMYKASLNQLIPTGDTSIQQGNGAPTQSKTHAGVQMQQQALSIDDEDFKDNFYITYAAVARSMINTHFANMQGNDTIHVDNDERELLQKAGIDFPANPDGTPSSKLNLEWNKARGTFDFIVDPSSDMFTDDEQQIEVLNTLLGQINLQTMWMMGQDGYKFNSGEAYYNLFKLMNLENFSKIMVKMTPEEAQQAKQQPFPIIDHPQIRLTGVIPDDAMPGALSQGGVQVPQGVPLGANAPDLVALLADPSTTINEKAQIKQRFGIQPDPAAQLPQPDQPTPTGPSDAELALKAKELELKQQDSAIRAQQVHQDGVKLSLQAHDQGHRQGLDELKLLQQQQAQAHSQKMAETTAKQAAQAPTRTANPNRTKAKSLATASEGSQN